MAFMEIVKSPRSRLTLILWLVAIHSFLVGVGLILRPATLMQLFAFSPCSERFFPVQGGVFHIVMVVAYIIAATDVDRYHYLVVYSVIVKAIAAVFLLTYFLAVDNIPLVLASGAGDGAMGVVIYLALRSYSTSKMKPNSTPGAI